MWEVITDKDGIDVSYRWFAFRKKAEAFAFQLKPSENILLKTSM